MNEARINVIINISNSMAIAFTGIAGGLYLEWKSDNLGDPPGILLFCLGIISGILTVVFYWYILKLTKSENDESHNK